MHHHLSPFHLAFPVHDLTAARAFYGDVIGCPEGRSNAYWVDFNFFGHQIVAHLDASGGARKPIHNSVDGHEVPVPHFGVVLWDDFHALAERIQKASITFVIAPYVRFAGEAGEQITMFFYDPSGNALKFKAFRNINQLFATRRA